MPIPTDTFWNVKRLNLVFAASALLLLAVTGLAILQDYAQDWREPQRQGQVWQAALVDQKIERDQTPEAEAELAQLKAVRGDLAKQVGPDTPGTQKLAAVVRQLTSDVSNMEFALNTLKSQVTVTESQLQDAVTADQKDQIRSLSAQLKGPRAQLDQDTEALFQKKQELERAKKELADHTQELDARNKEITKKQADLDAQRKKRAALQPKGLIPSFSQFVRRTPLLQFINPPEKVQQVVLPDVLTSLGGVKNVETIDRCATCHVNITNKDFTEPKVLEYLEEQIATSRAYRLPTDPPTSSSAPAATKAHPGAAAMPEF